MRSGRLTVRHRSFAVSLVVVGLLCFVCALCSGLDLATVDTATVSADDQASDDEAQPPPTSQRGVAHACEVGDAQGIPSPNHPFAAGMGLLPVLGLLVPRPEPLPRAAGSSPVARFGHWLLRLLCVQRV